MSFSVSAPSAPGRSTDVNDPNEYSIYNEYMNKCKWHPICLIYVPFSARPQQHDWLSGQTGKNKRAQPFVKLEGFCDSFNDQSLTNQL